MFAVVFVVVFRLAGAGAGVGVGAVVFALGVAAPVLGVGVGAVAVVTLKLGPYDIIHPYNNYGVKLCAFFWRLCRFL